VHHTVGPVGEDQFIAVGSIEVEVRCTHCIPSGLFAVEPENPPRFRIAVETMHIDLVIAGERYVPEPVGWVQPPPTKEFAI
jgi:hypothetical protein